MEIVILLLLIGVNGVLALSEMAVVSARRARLQQWASQGDQKARGALELATEPGRFLSTVQLGMTLVGVLVGAFGGATLAEPVARLLRRIPALAPYAGPASLGLVVLAIAYLTLVVGELVPKRLALFNPERVAMAVATPMRLMARIASPLVHLLNASTEGALRLLGVAQASAPPVTEEEINVLINEGVAAGVFEAAEPDLVRRVFLLADLEVEALMTPRLDISWLDLDEPLAENQRRIVASPYSRFPVGRSSLDNVVGILRVRDLLARSLSGKPLDLAASAAPPLFVPESLSALHLLERFKQSRRRTALVVDEYGGIQGLVTLTDVMEAIVGDLPSSGAPADPDVVRRADGTLLLDGTLPVDELKHALHLHRPLPNEERGDYQTLGGFMMMQLGRIPAVGDSFDYASWRLEVRAMDGHRVDKVLAAPLA